MKPTTNPARSRTAPRAAKSPSPQRRAAQQIFRLANEFLTQLQTLEKHSPARLEFSASSGTALAGRGSPDGSDIMALAFIVMMESAKSAREDLKAIMAQVKAITAAKQAWREAAGLAARESACDSDALFQLVATLHTGQVISDVAAFREGAGPPSQSAELESLRLQMAIDRISKLMSVLSHLLKRLADTQSRMVQNLK
jgi:hypothetical protein